MLKDQCRHNWRQFKNADIDSVALYECTKCKIWLSASDVYQLETLSYLFGFGKFLSVIAIVISIISLWVSLQK